MMFPSLFISSFRQYFFAIISFTILWCAFAFLFAQIENKRSSDDELFEYQFYKLETAKNIDTIFLGDSSLGNAINAKLWSKLSGDKTLNLALTGVYGYEGAYVMMLNALSKNIRPKKILLFFEPQQMLGNISYAAFTKSHVDLDPEIPFLQKLFLYWKMNMNSETLGTKFSSLIKKTAVQKQEIDFASDYMKQKKSKREENKFDDLRPSKTAKDLNPEKFIYLKKISELCKNNNINCAYVHGTIINDTCKKLKAFTKTGEKFIRETGLKFVSNNFYCTSDIDMGDSASHIHPDMKDVYTERYFKLLNNF